LFARTFPSSSAFPESEAGRPLHYAFRGLLSVYSRYGLHARRVANATFCTEGFSSFVASAAASIATAWNEPAPGRNFSPAEDQRLFTAHSGDGVNQVNAHSSESRCSIHSKLLKPDVASQRPRNRKVFMFVPQQLPPKSSPPDTFVYLLAFGLLAATAVLLPSAETQQWTGSSTTASPSAEKVITVWKVGSPHSGDTPDTTDPTDLESSAEELGYKLSIESFSANGFAQTFFDAFANNQEPDILVVDNDGIINGITTPLGSFTGIRSNGKIRQSLMKVSESLKGLEV